MTFISPQYHLNATPVERLLDRITPRNLAATASHIIPAAIITAVILFTAGVALHTAVAPSAATEHASQGVEQ